MKKERTIPPSKHGLQLTFIALLLIGLFFEADIVNVTFSSARKFHAKLLQWSVCKPSTGFFTYPGVTCGFDDIFLSYVSNDSVAAFHRNLTARPHTAGTPSSLKTADFIKSKFQEFGLKTHISEFFPALSYPVTRSLSIVHPSSRPLPLDEEAVEGDSFSSQPGIIPPYLAYVPSGNVTGEVVYANYGRTEDYETLAKLGVNVTGAISIVRYRSIFRGDKVANAARAGAIATIIYSDPEDEAASLKEGVYPNSKWLPSFGVQRGSALPRLQGDPTTPGWASVKGSEHLPASHPDVHLPLIPGLPISYGAASPILEALGGPDAPESWTGGLNLSHHSLGKGPVKVNLNIKMDLSIVPIHNVHAVIEGSDEPDRYVIIGNHHDAWTFGAVDPNSGTAALIEVARGLGIILRAGWRPRRTLILCSWDAEEMGLVGSTEWVEANSALLADRAVVYINVDSATNGGGYLHGGATPQLDYLLWEAASKVKDPVDPSLSLLDTWLQAHNSSESGYVLPAVRRLGGSGTDYAAFVSHLGIAAIDLTYAVVNGSYPTYHTTFDNPHWFGQFADPGFHCTTSVAQLYGVLAIWLSDRVILPFNYETYANELKRNVDALERRLKDLASKRRQASDISLEPIRLSLDALSRAAEIVNTEREEVSLAERQSLLRGSTSQAVRSLNDRLALAERAFIAPEGLKGRPWFRHLVYAPVNDNGYGSESFPGIIDAFGVAESSDAGWDELQHEVYRVARSITNVASVLTGQLQ